MFKHAIKMIIVMGLYLIVKLIIKTTGAYNVELLMENMFSISI